MVAVLHRLRRCSIGTRSGRSRPFAFEFVPCCTLFVGRRQSRSRLEWRHSSHVRRDQRPFSLAAFVERLDQCGMVSPLRSCRTFLGDSVRSTAYRCLQRVHQQYPATPPWPRRLARQRGHRRVRPGVPAGVCRLCQLARQDLAPPAKSFRVLDREPPRIPSRAGFHTIRTGEFNGLPSIVLHDVQVVT